MTAAIFADDREPCTRALALALAAGAHLALLYGTLGLPVGREAPPPVATEIELAPTPPPPPPPLPPPPAEPEPPRAAALPSAPVTRAPSRAVARAGRIVTSRRDVPAVEGGDVADFVVDPERKSYGSGVVTGADPAPAPRVRPGPVASAPPPADLGRAAHLDQRDPCAGSYPREAHVDGGTATVALIIGATGSVTSASVVSESPAGEGFGRAARECLAQKSFGAALDPAGKAVASSLTIRVRFRR